jgi:hypothetical protein
MHSLKARHLRCGDNRTLESGSFVSHTPLRNTARAKTITGPPPYSAARAAEFPAARKDQRLEVTSEDNGAGFPFSGAFTLEELELMLLGRSAFAGG